MRLLKKTFYNLHHKHTHNDVNRTNTIILK